MTTLSRTELNGQQQLEKELARVKQVLNRGHDLTVRWIPGGSSKLSGEVKDNLILIYDEDIEAAVSTLKHEVVDYEVSKVIEPYMQVTNKLISLLNERAYQQKERLVESITKFL